MSSREASGQGLWKLKPRLKLPKAVYNQIKVGTILKLLSCSILIRRNIFDFINLRSFVEAKGAYNRLLKKSKVRYKKK